MNHFTLHKGKAGELSPFPHIVEFSKQKIQQVQFNSLEIKQREGIGIYFVTDGKFDWMIEGKQYILYPNDAVLACPWQEIGGTKGNFDIGSLSWLVIVPQLFESSGELILGDWSTISESDQRVIGKLFSLNRRPVLTNFKAINEIFQQIEKEIFEGEMGHKTRINQLIDQLLIFLARQLSKQDNQRQNFPQTFMKLENILRDNLAHAWTVEEMAALVGLGTTAFTEKVKAFSGFSPLNYLINIRISEAIKLLKRSDCSLTDIALDTGFYSSQHFSSTFKKLTGYTPMQFRKNSLEP